MKIVAAFDFACGLVEMFVVCSKLLRFAPEEVAAAFDVAKMLWFGRNV